MLTREVTSQGILTSSFCVRIIILAVISVIRDLGLLASPFEGNFAIIFIEIQRVRETETDISGT